MADYSHVFDACEKNYTDFKGDDIFSCFRQQPNIQPDMYSFVGTDDSPPDGEALGIAKTVDRELAEKYADFLQTRQVVGYGSYSPMHAQFNLHDSRHIMMSTILFSKIPDVSRVVEIGGGYGNWLWLNSWRRFENWTIVDLPHVLKLQKWYLEQQGVSCPYRLAEPGEKIEPPDLVIGAHSLSEISLDKFKTYFRDIILNSKYLFYAYHTFSLDQTILNEKSRIIAEHFDLVSEVKSQNGTVSNSLYKRRV
jgi:hypothetical protein